MPKLRNRLLSCALAALAVFALCGTAAAETILRASHQFPGGTGDVRDEMIRLMAKEAHDANVGLTIQDYPGASLFKPHDQWNAMVGGHLDISLFPPDYASGEVPEFSATLMPGLIRSQDRAKRINQSPFMRDIHAVLAKHGVMVLADAWFAGGMASSQNCIVRPDDLKGVSFRAAGPTFASMWQAAGAIIATPPSNEIYNAFQTGIVKATDTSLATFTSMRLYELVKCLTAPGNNALWMMYEPILMSKKSFDRLTKAQQATVLKAGKDAQAFYESRADAVNNQTVKVFEDHKVKVVTLSDSEFEAWIDLARTSSYAEFAKTVPDGKKLIDEALAVK